MSSKRGATKVAAVVVIAIGCIGTPGWTRVAGGGGAIVGSKASESAPAATSRWLAWTEIPRSRPRRNIVFARRGNNTFRVTPRGTNGVTAGGAIDGSTLVHSQRKNGQPNANIKFFNLRTKNRRNAPGPVNTSKHEWGASLSGRWLMFARDGAKRKIMLYNRATNNLQSLDARRVSRRTYIQPGHVAGHFGVWVDCPRLSRCEVIKINLRSGKRSHMPDPKNKSQYAASVTPNGTVFWAESEHLANCNSAVKMIRKPPGRARHKVMNFPQGTDTSTIDPLGKSGRSIVYDRYNCNTSRADIYRLNR